MAKNTKNVSQKWAENCANSRGTMVVLPSEFSSQANEVDEKVKQLRILEAELNNLSQNMWYAIRKHLNDKGISGALTMDMGWNAEAKEDNIWVINMTKPIQNGPGMRL